MFSHWEKTVLAEGVATDGTVVDASHVDLAIFSRGFQETYELRRRIRVAFPDGSSTEFVANVPLHQVQHLADRRTIDCWPRLAEVTAIGAKVPVRYDKSNHSRIVLDLPALVTSILAEADQQSTAVEQEP